MKKHMKRKGMAAAAALLSICMAFPGLAGQWNQDENGKWYERDDGTYIQNDWLQDTDGKWYYFDENGYAETGLVEGMFANYMMGPDGAMYTNCTVYINGKFYDADEYGILSPNKGGEGWIAGANGWWYRTDGDEFLKNQWMDEDGSWYYFGEDGYMVTGWLELDGKRYWLGEDGVMAVNTELTIDDVEYTVNEAGEVSELHHYKAPTVIPPEEEKSDLHKQVDQMADTILARITNDSMSKEEKARAIYSWVRGNLRYVNHSDKGDWVSAAYQGFRTKRGDCYTYYSVSLALLSRCDIPSIEVVRTDGHHWWNLIDCGNGWYPFDTTPRSAGGTFCLLTDAELEAYSQGVGRGSHTFDHSLYPPTP